MYAIIKDGGHQYRVEKGQRLEVELRPTEADATVTFDSVCLLAPDEGEAKIGTPFVAGARVEAKVLDPEHKAKKIHVRTFRRRKGTRRHLGHRQRYTIVEVTDIVG